MRFLSFIAAAIVLTLPIGTLSTPSVRGDLNASVVLEFVQSALSGSNITPQFPSRKRASSSTINAQLELLDARITAGTSLSEAKDLFTRIKDRAIFTNNTQVVALTDLCIFSMDIGNVAYNNLLSSLIQGQTVDDTSPDFGLLGSIDLFAANVAEFLPSVITNADDDLTNLINSFNDGPLGTLDETRGSLTGNSTIS